MSSQFDTYASILDCWKQGVNADSLYNTIQKAMNNNNDEEWPHDFWLVYMSVLVELNQQNQFNEMILKYVKKYGTYYPCGYLQVARHAPSDCLKFKEYCDCINKYIDNNPPIKMLRTMINGKTIAVVGNSGGILGSNKGEEIDSHDIVVRFNGYKTKEYSKDVGCKTNIWIRVMTDDIFDQELEENNYDLIVYASNLNRYQISSDCLSKLNFQIEKQMPISFFPIEAYQLLREYGIKRPSSGLLIMALLLLSGRSLKKVDFFGFSFLESKPQYSHYYENIKWSFETHDLDKETKVIKRLRSFFYRLPRKYRKIVR